MSETAANSKTARFIYSDQPGIDLLQHPARHLDSCLPELPIMIAPNHKVITYSHGPGRETHGLGARAERGLPWIGKPLAFCAMQGELHATNAGTGTCRPDRSEARCQSVAGKSAESVSRRSHGWVYAGPEHDYT
jgi:hypothetical protein